MKKLGFFLTFLLLILGIGHQIVHSHWLKQKTFSIVQTTLQESNWEIHVDQIHTVFPTIDIEGVKINTPEGVLELGSIQGTLSLWRLLKQEIYFSKMRINKVYFVHNTTPSPFSSSIKSKTYPELHFQFKIRSLDVNQIALSNGYTANLNSSLSIKTNLEHNLQIHTGGTFVAIQEGNPLYTPIHFKGQMVRHANGNWEIEPFKAFTDQIQMKGVGTLDGDGNLLQASLQLQTDHLHTQTKIADLTYQILARIDIKKEEDKTFALHTAWQIPSLKADSQQIEHLEGLIDATYKEGSLIAKTAQFSADFLRQKWTVSFPFSKEKEKPLLFPEILLSSSLMKGEGNASWESGSLLSAYATFSIPHIHDLSSDIYGTGKGQFSWETVNGIPSIHLDIECGNLSYGPLKAEKVWIYSQLNDPWNQEKWEISSEITDASFHSLKVNSAYIKTSNAQEQWPFECTCIGTWTHPLALDLTGMWHLGKEELSISLMHGVGSFFNHPLFLLKPSHCIWSPKELNIDALDIQISEAKITSHLIQKNHHTDFQISAHSIPLDFLSLNPLEIMISGVSDFECTLQGPDDALKGNLVASISKMDLFLLGQRAPISAQGSLTCHLEKDRVQIQSSLISKENPILSLDLSIPIHVSVRPFHIDPLYLHSVQGHFFFASRLEEFLDFFNLGTHRIEGNAQCDLALTGTLGHPHLYGECTLSEGFYQNYFTGTELQNIEAKFIAKKNRVLLTSFVAQDAQNKGSFESTGFIELLPQEQFPFQFDIIVSRLNCATFDLITTEASGKFQIKGNLTEATAEGNLEILESDITIPSRIPRTIPKLEVVYTHANAPPAAIPLPPRPTYPLHLDLKVHAPDGIFISGRGIESEWKGDFHVGGTQIDLATVGNIELIQGSFLFSGRSFILKEGSLKFSGIPNAPPTLHLAADIQVKDILITANLNGPLNNPQITLQSSPPLPLGTIMSYLLFGHDLGEINSSQALKFAGALTSLAGEGPGILEQTKKSLGVDRIQIITVPSPSAEGGETIAVQVGKYVADGVLVSYSQGAENSSGNINIEVELQNNLSLILESDQSDNQQQGKFTLKWNKTY